MFTRYEFNHKLTGSCEKGTYHKGEQQYNGSGECAFEPPHDKTNKMTCAPSEDSDQHWHPPSLIRVFAVRMKKAWVLSYPFSGQRRLWSDWAGAQADLSLRYSDFVGFVMRRLICALSPKPLLLEYTIPVC